MAWLLLGATTGACGGSQERTEAGQREVAAAEPQATDLEPAADRDLVAVGRQRITEYECNRCHEIDGVEPPSAEYDCAGCHRQIMEGTFEAEDDELHGWQANIVALGEVPALRGTHRFRRSWLASFVRQSHDLRPNLRPSMPRFAMETGDAEAIAAFLSPQAQQAAPELGDPQRGREVLASKGCGSCHRFTGVPALPAGPPPIELSSAALARGQQLAPDLRFTRDRLRPAAVVAWLADPSAIKQGSAMPTIPMTEQEVADAAAYLLRTPLAAPEPVPMPERLGVLDREVSFAEVDQRVFSKICRHCHGSPEIVAGGGPGYAGGFGFVARKLDLSSHQGILTGSVADDGKRRSVLAGGEDGMPKIVAHLWARHAEEAGQPMPGVRGMPLGLPPIPPEDIALVETWIAQGRRP